MIKVSANATTIDKAVVCLEQLIVDLANHIGDVERERDDMTKAASGLSADLSHFGRKLDKAEETLREAQEIQGRRLAWFREQGIVFDKAPGDQSDFWQTIAFWIYTDLCEVESLARSYLSTQEET